MKRGLCLLLACFLLIGGTSCREAGQGRRYFAYLDAPAKAELTGKINSLCFSATLETAGRGADSTVDAALTFVAPDSLAGVTLVCRNGTWSASLGLLTGEADGEGLARVATLLTEERAVRSSKSEGNCTVLTLSDGATLVLDAKTGAPLRAAWSDGGRAIEVVIVSWKERSL